MATNNMQIYGIIGNPIEHSMSPILQKALNEAMEVDAIYATFNVKDNIVDAIKGSYALGIKGLNVTIPYKCHVIPYLCDIDSHAEVIGAVNTLVYTSNGYKGYNTDLPGLYKSIVEDKIAIRYNDILIIGAGGAARAAAHMCGMHKARSIIIINRNIDNAKKLAGEIEYTDRDMKVDVIGLSDHIKFTGKDYIAIQSTSVGMYPHTNQCIINDDEFYEKCKVCIDLIYTPCDTLFLEKAKKAGCQTLGGLHMLINQGILAWELWNPGKKVKKEVSDNIYDIVKRKLEEK